MKDDRVPKGQRNKDSLLGTYFVSLFSMLLCFVMLFGTTFAWFNENKTASGNEINSGILEVDMLHEGVSLSRQRDHAVFSAGAWIPGQTVMETVTVKNTGTLPVQYKLDFVPPIDPSQESPVPDEVAQLFTVLVKAGPLTAADHQVASGPELLETERGWSIPGPLGTNLADVMDISSGIPLYSACLGPKTEQDISIALYMKQGSDASVMGRKGTLYLKLEAMQSVGDQMSVVQPGDVDWTDYEPEQTADISVADTARTQTVTRDNIGSVKFNRNDTTYVFQGAFESVSIPVNGELDQVFDGSQATVTGAVTLSGGDAAGGNYTVSGFTAGAVRVELDNARIQLLNNSCRFLGVTGAELELTVHGNLVGGDAIDGEQRNAVDADGICLNVAGYKLSFTDNTVAADQSDVLIINGRQDEVEYASSDVENTVTAFTGNKLSAGGRNTVAVRVRGDRTFAPAGMQEINKNAKMLIVTVLSGEAANSITVSDMVGQHRFGFGDLVVDDIPAEAVNEG